MRSDHAKAALLSNLDRFLKDKPGKERVTTAHFYYGWFNYHEWLIFHYRHFRHHFKQFGLLANEH